MKEMRAKVVAECTLKESAAINQILGRKVSRLFSIFGFALLFFAVNFSIIFPRFFENIGFLQMGGAGIFEILTPPTKFTENK
jgi:hypothetical protein